MKLTDLNPMWFGCGGEGITDKDGNPVPRREKIGISFDCPNLCGERCFIPFQNPPDGKPPLHSVAWTVHGEGFETLTLTPSIQRVGDCAWHGFITNGEVIKA